MTMTIERAHHEAPIQHRPRREPHPWEPACNEPSRAKGSSIGRASCTLAMGPKALQPSHTTKEPPGTQAQGGGEAPTNGRTQRPTP